jgi:SAM-dependent methyltransferase
MLHQVLRRAAGRFLRSHSSEQNDLESYIRGGRRPWSPGYLQYRDRFITATLADPALLQRFRSGQSLPAGYGEFLDDRAIEYPWLFARMNPDPGRLLDAGSVLNYTHLLDHPLLEHKHLSLVTLAPEGNCYWQRGNNYVFADLRELPFRDNYFDEVVCVSTLEHVGKDNSRVYGGARENDAGAFRLAVKELRRVCKPGGRVLITVPFGRFTDFGWYQQFDAGLVDEVIAVFAPADVKQSYFRYAGGGWQFSSRDACAECEGFNIHATRYMDPGSTRDYDPDFAAASRANAALALVK